MKKLKITKEEWESFVEFKKIMQAKEQKQEEEQTPPPAPKVAPVVKPAPVPKVAVVETEIPESITVQFEEMKKQATQEEENKNPIGDTGEIPFEVEGKPHYGF